MAPTGDDRVKLDISEATEVSAKAVNSSLKTPENMSCKGWASASDGAHHIV
jgi:hypothetical protein